MLRARGMRYAGSMRLPARQKECLYGEHCGAGLSERGKPICHHCYCGDLLLVGCQHVSSSRASSDVAERRRLGPVDLYDKVYSDKMHMTINYV